MTTALNQTDLIAESAILGSMMIDPSVCDPVFENLRAEHFGRKTHQQLFEVIKGLHASGIVPDLGAIEEQVINRHNWNAQARAALIDLMTSVPATTLSDHYVKKIREQYQARQIQYAARELAIAAASRDMTKATAVIDQLSAISTDAIVEPVTTLSDAAQEYAEMLALIESGDLRRFKCGLPVFDDIINAGLHPGILPRQVGVVCGRTGYGKSTLAAFIAFQMVTVDPSCRVHFFSLEMPAEMIGGKAVKRQIAADCIKADSAADRAKIAATNLRGTWGDRVTISGEHEPDQVIARAAQMARGGTNVFVFDHLHRISLKGKTEPRWAYGNFMLELTNHAKRHNVAWLVAAQLSRKYSNDFTNTKRMPMDSDLAESGMVEQHMHWCVALHFDDPKNRNVARLCVIKNRHGVANTSETVGVDYEKQSYTRRYPGS